MDEKTKMPVVPQVLEETERIGAARNSDNQESSLDTCDTALMPSSTTAVSTETASTTIVSHNDMEQPTIESLTLEIKFHLNQMGFHVIEVGKRLILAKELVPHGHWYNLLEKNFHLKKTLANNFMQVAKRLGNLRLKGDLNQTQLIAMLALPEGDEEKFIAERAAEGNPVDQMTIKNLRAEIKYWKDEADKIKVYSATQIKKWQDTAGALELKVAMQKDVMHRKENKFEDKISDLELDLESAQKDLKNLESKLAIRPTIEVTPPDYADLQREVKEFRERPIEFALPDDYESSKQELANLKARENSFKHDFALTHAFNQFFSLIPTLLNADNLQSVV